MIYPAAVDAGDLIGLHVYNALRFAGEPVSVLGPDVAGAMRTGTASARAAAALLDDTTHRYCSLLLLVDGNSSSHTVFQVTLILFLITAMMLCCRFIVLRAEWRLVMWH